MELISQGFPLYLRFLSGLHGDAEVFDLRLHALFVLLQLYFKPGEVLQLLAQLCHRVRVLLPQPCRRGLRLERCLVQLPPQLQQFPLPLPVLLDLKGRQQTKLWGFKSTEEKVFQLFFY